MKRQRLGQHYLVDRDVIRKIVESADVQPFERVLEIGTGKGALSKELVGVGASFTGYEVDRENYEATSKALRGFDAKIIREDAFAQDREFDVLVTSLPFSESAKFVRWLSERTFARAVAVLQNDFADKIMAPPGDRDYRGISAIAQIAFDVSLVAKVGRGAFEPPPRVDSAVVSFIPKRRVAGAESGCVIRLFSLRRRQVDSVLAELKIRVPRSYGRRRVFSLSPEEVHDICRACGPQ